MRLKTFSIVFFFCLVFSQSHLAVAETGDNSRDIISTFSTNICRASKLCNYDQPIGLNIEQLLFDVDQNDQLKKVIAVLNIKSNNDDNISSFAAHMECSTKKMTRLERHGDITRIVGGIETEVNSGEISIEGGKSHAIRAEFKSTAFTFPNQNETCEFSVIISSKNAEKNNVESVKFDRKDCSPHNGVSELSCHHNPSKQKFWFRAYDVWLNEGKRWRPLDFATEINQKCLGAPDCYVEKKFGENFSVIKVIGQCINGKKSKFDELYFVLKRGENNRLEFIC